MASARIVWIFGLIFGLSSLPAFGARAFRSSPIPWFHALNVGPAGWSAGSNGYYQKQFSVAVRNVSATPQNVRVTLVLRDAEFTVGAVTSLNSRIYLTRTPHILNTLGAAMTNGVSVQPVSGYQALTAVGTTSDEVMFDWAIQYAGPASASAFLWLKGSVSINVEVLEDRGTVAATVYSNAGCAGGCPVDMDVNSVQTSTPLWLQLNGGRPF